MGDRLSYFGGKLEWVEIPKVKRRWKNAPTRFCARVRTWKPHTPQQHAYVRAGVLRGAKVSRARKRAVVDALKQKPCQDCGVAYPPYVMDFDHVWGKKFASVADIVASTSSERMLLEEIEKCDLVCANCHRERTHRRLKGGRE